MHHMLALLANNKLLEDEAMPQTVKVVYHDDIVELKQNPVGIQSAEAFGVFLDAEQTKVGGTVDLNRVVNSLSSVDKWIGLIEGAELGNWKAERREIALRE